MGEAVVGKGQRSSRAWVMLGVMGCVFVWEGEGTLRRSAKERRVTNVIKASCGICTLTVPPNRPNLHQTDR